MTRLTVIGDLAILLLFAAIGRASHQEGSDVAGTLAVAAPFIAGWFAAAALTLPYTEAALRSPRAALMTTLRTWLIGGVVGLVIRSILEWRIAPLTFALVTLVFNGVLLGAWHATVARLQRGH